MSKVPDPFSTTMANIQLCLFAEMKAKESSKEFIISAMETMRTENAEKIAEVCRNAPDGSVFRILLQVVTPSK